MRFNLAAMAVRAGLKRRETTFAAIIPTRAQANSLVSISNAILAPWYSSWARIEPVYERELVRVLQQDSIDDLTRLFAEIGDEVQRLVLNLNPAMAQWALQLEGWHRGKWARTILAGAHVDVSTLIGPQDALESIEQFMARNTALIRQVSDDTRGKVADIVYRGLQERTPARTVGKAISETLGLARARSNRIAADQRNKLSAALDRERQRQAGLDVFRYRHSGKLHFRPWHQQRDGKLYENDTLREVEFVKGERTYPGETIKADDAPGIPPFCGCVTAGVLIIDNEVL